MDIIESMKKEMIRRKYSSKTVCTYTSLFRDFLNKTKKDVIHIKKEDIKQFLYDLAENGKSESTLNLYLQAIKFPLENILNKKQIFVNIPFSRAKKRLPEFLTKSETKRLIESIKNEKHKLMIELMYSAGLRVGEFTNLKLEDLDFDNGYGWVRQGKGKKDRLFIIAESVKDRLKDHIKKNNITQGFLFSGRRGNISIRSVQEIVRRAAKVAGIKKRIHPHSLRHSFATHLIENDYDVTTVQSLLGHNSPETTMIYLHMKSPKKINVKSPLDSL